MAVTEIAALIGFISVILSACVSLYIGKINIKNDREKFYEDKISQLLETQAKEIQSLRSEIEKLVKENEYLRKQLEKGNYIHERTIEEISC